MQYNMDTIYAHERAFESRLYSTVTYSTLSLCASGITNLIRPVSGKKARILPSSHPLIRTDPEVENEVVQQ